MKLYVSVYAQIEICVLSVDPLASFKTIRTVYAI